MSGTPSSCHKLIASSSTPFSSASSSLLIFKSTCGQIYGYVPVFRLWPVLAAETFKYTKKNKKNLIIFLNKYLMHFKITFLATNFIRITRSDIRGFGCW